jgi:ethanolamine permease
LLDLPGFAQILNLTGSRAIWIIVPIIYGNGSATCYALMKLIASMSRSRLLPGVLSQRPVFSLLGGIIASLIALFPAIVDTSILLVWPSIIGVCALLTYCIQLFSFMVLRLKLDSLPREFRSPFGIFGTIFSTIVFLIGIISGLSVRSEALTAVSVIVVYLTLMSLYYRFHAKHVQVFSDAEKLVVLPAHVGILNTNGKAD